MRRCWNENLSQRGWAPRPSVEQPRNDTRRCPEGLGRLVSCSLCSVSNSLSHPNLSNKVRGIFFLKKSSSSFIIASICILHVYVYICIFIMWLYNSYHHHHHVVLVARISLTVSRHFSLSFIASGRSSGQHPVSSHSC